MLRIIKQSLAGEHQRHAFFEQLLRSSIVEVKYAPEPKPHQQMLHVRAAAFPLYFRGDRVADLLDDVAVNGRHSILCCEVIENLLEVGVAKFAKLAETVHSLVLDVVEDDLLQTFAEETFVVE